MGGSSVVSLESNYKTCSGQEVQLLLSASELFCMIIFMFQCMGHHQLSLQALRSHSLPCH